MEWIEYNWAAVESLTLIIWVFIRLQTMKRSRKYVTWMIFNFNTYCSCMLFHGAFWIKSLTTTFEKGYINCCPEMFSVLSKRNYIKLCWMQAWCLSYRGRRRKKKASFLPPPPNMDNLYNFLLNAKNVDLSGIQNDSLSKILLK